MIKTMILLFMCQILCVFGNHCRVVLNSTRGFFSDTLQLNGTLINGLITIEATLNSTDRMIKNPTPGDLIEFQGVNPNNPILRLETSLVESTDKAYIQHAFVVSRALKLPNESTYKIRGIDVLSTFDHLISPNHKDVTLQILVSDKGSYDIFLLGFKDSWLWKFNSSSEWDKYLIQPLWETSRIVHKNYNDGPAAEITLNKITVCDHTCIRTKNEEHITSEQGKELSLICDGTGPSFLAVDWIDEHGTLLDGRINSLNSVNGYDHLTSIYKVVVSKETNFTCRIYNRAVGKGSGIEKIFHVSLKSNDEISWTSVDQVDCNYTNSEKNVHEIVKYIVIGIHILGIIFVFVALLLVVFKRIKIEIFIYGLYSELNLKAIAFWHKICQNRKSRKTAASTEGSSLISPSHVLEIDDRIQQPQGNAKKRKNLRFHSDPTRRIAKEKARKDMNPPFQLNHGLAICLVTLLLIFQIIELYVMVVVMF